MLRVFRLSVTILFISLVGILLYVYSVSKEHSLVLLFMLILLTSSISVVEFLD